MGKKPFFPVSVCKVEVSSMKTKPELKMNRKIVWFLNKKSVAADRKNRQSHDFFQRGSVFPRHKEFGDGLRENPTYVLHWK